ncbi:hypothetical protein SAMN05216184_11722 [Georgenia satyanarayanai]|uniref:Heavy metal transporter n=1 Tax=Georgenia satyanarayanai TaxID=860221 RepID=A0A2Y9APU4_9MICO|nr:hypothetical protein [Georgenia satyanarayanai]PYF96804.1 hypothetical protein A8987_11722 [Georgenia satyanarayanai]SSA46400.1 hypothetical protein SAMN05216184_11722 [Georgenia satyanarayanai]
MRRRLLRGTVGVLALVALAVGGVAILLTRLVPDRASETCAVVLEDGTRHVLDADQADNAALITAVTVRRGLPARAATIALATAVQESKLRNIDYGDRDSLGLFQQRPSQGWGTPEQVTDPVYATNAFLDGLVEVPGYTELPVTEAAQTVQRSGFPEAYADHEPEGRAFASALTGHSPASLTCDLPGQDDAAAPAEAVSARLEQDFGIATTAAGGAVVVEASALPGQDPQRLAWAVAHWAVATAVDTGAGTVAVGDRVWQRSEGNEAQWRPAERAPAPAGTVRIS